MSNKEPFSISKRLKSFVYAFNGLKLFFRTEHNARIHIAAAILVVFLGKLLKISNCEWCLLSVVIGIVFISEIFNTAIEQLTDMISPEYSEKAKIVKDLAAGAVLMASVIALTVGLIVFVSKI